MKNLVLELENSIGYGYMAYLENEAHTEIYDFLNRFSMWGGSTKTYKNYKMYELSEDCIKFMQTPLFKSFLTKNSINLIASNDIQYPSTIKLVFDI